MTSLCWLSWLKSTRTLLCVNNDEPYIHYIAENVQNYRRCLLQRNHCYMDNLVVSVIVLFGVFVAIKRISTAA